MLCPNLMSLFIPLIFGIFGVASSSGNSTTTTLQCAFRGTCGHMVNAFGLSLPIPCVHSGPPEALPVHEQAAADAAAALKTLRQYVPEYFSESFESPKLCCTAEQAQQLVTQLDIPHKLLGHCPSCYYNLARLFFGMTCAPNQAGFVKVLRSNQTTKRVEAIEYRLSAEHAHFLFESCAGVQSGAGTGFKIVSTLMCATPSGGGNNSSCSSELFLQYLGSKGVAPMEIHFRQVQTVAEKLHAHELPVYQCSVAPKPFSDKVCACADCHASCGSH